MARVGKPLWFQKDPNPLKPNSYILNGNDEIFGIKHSIGLVKGAFRNDIISMVANLVLWAVGFFLLLLAFMTFS
ncbi:MAG: hypothetical protein D6732_08175 [Methanobacteriota archaeon]|nr:MAG: hypothetical protein D6732_08175 [Euryarchaeota archaeon]